VVATLSAHEAEVKGIVFSHDDRLLVTTSSDGSCRIWETEGWQEQTCVREHEGEVICCDISRDSRLVVTGGADNAVVLQSLEGAVASTLYKTTCRSYVMSVCFSEEGTRVAAGDHAGCISVIDIASLSLLWSIKAATSICQITAHASGFLVSTLDGCIHRLVDRSLTAFHRFQRQGHSCIGVSPSIRLPGYAPQPFVHPRRQRDKTAARPKGAAAIVSMYNKRCSRIQLPSGNTA
jgi:WD40 repeat protein